jgi:pilus assembly protein FimV
VNSQIKYKQKFQKRIAIATIGVSLLVSALGAYAVGLGDINSDSRLGEPLDASVRLTNTGDLTQDQLIVRLGNDAQYQQLGLERVFLHQSLRFDIRQENETLFVAISTKDPINEPFLDFVLHLGWPTGSLVKEFTLLLDPPAISIREAIPVTQTARWTELPATAPLQEKERKIAVTPVAAKPVTPPPEKNRYKTKQGDTLWGLAKRFRPSAGMGMTQMMDKLFAANPSAFINNDPSRLRRDYWLEIPVATAPASLEQRVTATAATNNSEPAQPMQQVEEQATNTPLARDISTDNSTPIANGKQRVTELKTRIESVNEAVSGLNSNIVVSRERIREMDTQIQALSEQLLKKESAVEKLSDATDSQQQAPATNVAHHSAAIQTSGSSYLAWFVVLAGAVIAMVLLRRKKHGHTADSPSPMATASPLPANRESTHRAMPTPVNTFISASNNETTGVEVRAGHSDDSDLLMVIDSYFEAERYQQAYELISTELRSNPDRPELKLRLAESHLVLGKLEEFDALLGELESAGDPELGGPLASLKAQRDTGSQQMKEFLKAQRKAG